jgi:succinate dehydrogenase / fumarate reductase, flavoprotein subunit
MILQTLYQQCLKHNVTFFDEFHVVDLIRVGDTIRGAIAIDVATGEFHIFHTKAVLFATGGWGRCWEVTSNAHSLTGDGSAICLRRGVPLQDMEFFQFHPTGIFKLGILITEGVRGEGGVLINTRASALWRNTPPQSRIWPAVTSSAAPFSSRYRRAGASMASATCISTCDLRSLIVTSSKEGESRRIDAAYIEAKLPDIADFTRTYLGIDPVKEPMPVQPTAHYAMGGIPTDVDGRVVIDAQPTVLPGLYAAGEAACVSVHGANRLGTNSLTDLVVFGRRAGVDMARFCNESELLPLPDGAADEVMAEFARLREAKATRAPLSCASGCRR